MATAATTATVGSVSTKLYAIQNTETGQLFGGFNVVGTHPDGSNKLAPRWSSTIALISADRVEVGTAAKTLRKTLGLQIEVLRFDKGILDIPAIETGE